MENSGRPLPVNVAAAISSDPAFEDLAHRDGIDNIIAMAKTSASARMRSSTRALCQTDGSVAATIKACNDLTGTVNGLRTNFSPTQVLRRPRRTVRLVLRPSPSARIR